MRIFNVIASPGISMRVIMILYLFAFIFMLVPGCNMNYKGNKNEAFDNIPGTYTMNQGANDILIPFELYAGNKPMIQAQINGKSAKFLIDNGKLFDEVWFYNGEVDSLQVQFQSQIADSLIGIGENSATQIYKGNEIDLDFGSIQFLNQPTLISPSEVGFSGFFPGINGQVSSMLFKHFIVEFNFDDFYLKLTKPDNFIIPDNFIPVKMHKRSNGSYCIPFELVMSSGSKHNVLLDIDIGTVFPLYLISNADNKIPISDNAKREFLGYGASGELYGFRDTLKELRLNDLVLTDYPAIIVQSDTNSDTDIVESGTFGIQLMKRYNVTFDYFNEVMYFEFDKNNN